jgi:hypothetical protein
MSSSRSSVRNVRQSIVGACIALATLAIAQDRTAAQSQWVYFNHPGRLVYRPLKAGDRIIDFSYAGYMGGGVALPVVPVRRTVSPSGGDDTTAIQAAIDEVSRIAPVGGVRGAVLLSAGRFHCSKTLTIDASGVVLRGSGSGEAETTVELTGDPHPGISIAGESNVKPQVETTTLSDAYVAAGSLSLRVRDASLFHAGDTIQIVRPVTPAWLHFMEMDTMVRDGKKQTWVAGELTTERTIRAIEGDTLQLDVPLTDSYDAKYLGADGTTVGKIEHTGQIEQVGIENLRLVAPAKKITLSDPPFNGLVMKNARDSWVRNLRIVDTTEAVAIGKGTRRITVDRVDVTQSVPIQGAANPQTLVQTGRRFSSTVAAEAATTSSTS